MAAPISTIDFDCASGKDIPIEQRHEKVLISSPGSDVVNPAFDVTPAELVTAIITDKGIFKPQELANIKR